MAVTFCVVTLCVVVVVLFCVISTSSSERSERINDQKYSGRARYKRQAINYDLELQSRTFPENSPLSTVFFDFNSVNIDGQAASSYRFIIIKNRDSKPPLDSLFGVDNREVKFYTGFTVEDRKKNFDYEQYPSVVIAIEAIRITNENEKKLIKLTIPLSDVNDELPVLENKPFPYLATVPVKPSEGQTIYQLLAEDADTNADIEYSIDFAKLKASGDTRVSRFFRMDHVPDGTGEKQVVVGHIRVATRTEFIRGEKFVIPVNVTDKNGQGQSITADVLVLVGPRAPQFYEQKYKGSIFETESSNNPVYAGDDSPNQLIVQVVTFQDNFPKTFRVLEDNNKESKHFRIDEKGHIFNKEPLDYDIEVSQRPPIFSLIIKVTETIADGTTLENTVPLEIVVKDENDNAPKFQLTQYLETINEDREVGSTILKVLAEDYDSGKNADVTYELKNSENSENKDYFDIQKIVEGGRAMGAITIKKGLDFDAKPGPIYRFMVVAKDNGAQAQSSSVDVIISTANVNDVKPKIQEQGNVVLRDKVDVSKQAFFLTRVRAQDDDGDGVHFYLSDNGQQVTKKDIFRIIPSSGVIEVYKPVPRDIDSYSLEVIAIDDGQCCGGVKENSDKVEFLVEIVDSQNQKPTFDNCLAYTENASFKEESDPDTLVIKVNAEDSGRGLNGIVTYTIVSPNPDLPNAPFKIDKDSGQISIQSKVDREEQGVNFIQVTVKATDKGESPQEGWCTFRVQIEDINDNTPIFPKDSYMEQISSTVRQSQILLRVGATDRDIGINAEFNYSLVEDGGGMFGIYEDTGLIYLKKTLAAGIKKYTLTAKVEDKGTPKLHSTVEVIITISSQEASIPPSFEDAQRKFTVAETIPNNHLISKFKCVSNDKTDNRVQFFLVSLEGELRSRKEGKFSIESSTVGNEVSLYVAESLDYETKKQHFVTLRCQNLAILTMYEQIQLTIDVEDKNDEVPSFPGWISNGRYQATVQERKGPSEVVTTDIQATDRDISSQYNKISYEILESSYEGVLNDFSIRTIEGNRAEILTKREFDREDKDRYLLIVVANDIVPSDIITHKPEGTPNSANVLVEVFIGDVNDNPMKFKQTLYNFTVEETANIGQLVYPVTADDPDEVDKEKLLYSFTDTNSPFDIRDRTGEIFVIGKLDYESDEKEYRLTLESRDTLNEFSATTQVLITVTDENDNVPVFNLKEYKVENVEEENTTTTRENKMPLVKVKATDKDESRTTSITYKLLGEGTQPGPGQLFSINEENGQIYLLATLDRDKPRGKPEYIFTVEASDEVVDPQKGYANVKVFPIDINDNKPVFDRGFLTNNKIFENSPSDTFVAQVKASDADADKNAELIYDIVKSPATADDLRTNYFKIKDGQIITQVDGKYLDRDTDPSLEVIVKATDKGTPPQSDTATLTITLRDINDNVPIFDPKIYNISISEHASDAISDRRNNDFILEVQATDKDEEENALLTYSVDKNDHFKMDNLYNKGYMSLQFPVDYEKVDQRYFHLNIFVVDNDPNHKDTAVVHIYVTDFNDEEPKFVNSFQTVRIPEGETPGRNVTTFTATDADSGVNAELSYTIDRRSDPRREFYIDPNTGEVWTRRSLDRERDDRMEIYILAIDKGDPQLTGTATMEVIVEDINDNFPIFKDDYKPLIMENGGKSDLPLEIFAIDKDTDMYGAPFGFAKPDSCDDELACDKFSLKFKADGDGGKGTAIISTNETFDRETKKYYELPIVMWDMRGKGSDKAQTGTNTLTITIGDENDNRHSPGHQDVFVYNYKGTFGPLVIGRVYVEDKDDWDLPDKSFNFVSPASLKSSFSVNLENGDITMQKGVQANFDGEPYRFEVRVYDDHWKSAVVSTVAVTVMDLTEEAVSNSGGVRFSGITSSKFIFEPLDVRGNKMDSLYTKFRKLLASKLGYQVDNVEIITMRDDDDGDYLEVRYSAHASPYLSAAEMDNVVIMNQAEFEALGLKVSELPIDECQDEIFEGGCYNTLTITGKPVTVNANGTSYVGVEAYMVAKPGCVADVYPESNECTGDYCHNGGKCVKDDWGSLKCEDCPAGYTGSRCQEKSHSFDGDSVAVYKTLTQCEESQTSIEFITKEEEGVILYNGPLRNINPLETPQDFIILMLKGGFPLLRIDHGTGTSDLTLNGKDQNGKQLLQKLNDGKWHHIDINRIGKEVEMVVDRCAVASLNFLSIDDDSACRVKKETPGANMYLNVNTLLQLGGVRLLEPGVKHLTDLNLKGFDGCLRNFVHNKQLYDLHYKEIQGVNTGKNGCPREDVFCRPPGQLPKCGDNGDCEATLSGVTTCTCHPEYWGAKCGKKATTRKILEEGYYLWQIKNDAFNKLIRNWEIKIQIMFRTRERSGALLVLEDTSSASTISHIRLMLNQGILTLSYNLGDSDKKLELANATANNGQWHVLTMERYGTQFYLKMDNGEGRNYAYTLGSKDGKERSVFRLNRGVFSSGARQSSDDLKETCIQDVRINNGYFAMTTEENDDPDSVARMDENPNTDEGCRADDCQNDECKTVPNTYCHSLWNSYECRCNPGYHGLKCVSMCNPNPCFNNGTCQMKGTDFECKCQGRWSGKRCRIYGHEEVSRGAMDDTALIAVIVSIIIVILIALLVFFIYMKLCKNGEDGEKYILEVDPEDDIRENVMNYDEEGAGEKDQDAYDISHLQPINETMNRPYEMDKRRNMPLRNAPGEKPDVGNFIEDRMLDADNDDGAPPHDSVREFNFEGGDSDAGSLSSLNTSSSDRSQDYDYLNEWGPKFSKLADMYGAGQDLPNS